MSTGQIAKPQPTLFGHPTGLFTLFFAEMWERFSFYGMRALLVFYMIKGFLGYNDKNAYAVYGAYTALVYMTPFFGGMLADQLLGARRAIVLGGILMAAGHLLMTIEQDYAFFGALALLIAGNGFFKPNISTIVGTLYPQGSTKRDGGFTIFYMGVNLGAAMAPLLCGYIGENYGWHYGFGLATIGMLVGIAVFVAPTILTQLMIGAGAFSAGIALFVFSPDNIFSYIVNIIIGVALIAAGIIAIIALGKGGLPTDAGAPPDPAKLKRPVLGPINAEWAVYLGSLVSVPILALLVSGFSPFTSDKEAVTVIPDSAIQQIKDMGGPVAEVAAVLMSEMSKPAGLILLLSGLLAFGYVGYETLKLDKIPRQRMYVVLILTFFSLLFWAFFEQAGSSVNNFTDRNVDRILVSDRVVTSDEVGTTIRIQPTQEQLGFINGKTIEIDPETKEFKYVNGEEMFTISKLDKIRDKFKEDAANSSAGEKTTEEINWFVVESNVGMNITQREREIPASWFQSINPLYILLFGLVFTALWSFLSSRGLEPNTAVKFSLGLFQVGLGFGCFWYGAQTADDRGMVGVSWLFLGYLFQTTGELCISPVGLSMVTRMAPRILVSTVMGMWFLATAFSQFLAAIIAQFTGVSEGGEGAETIPVPLETVDVYGSVFGSIALAAMISAGICLLLSPLLNYWMHEKELNSSDESEGLKMGSTLDQPGVASHLPGDHQEGIKANQEGIR